MRRSGGGQEPGEQPQAAESVGIDVNRYRYAAVIVGGMFAGLLLALMRSGSLSGALQSIIESALSV